MTTLALTAQHAPPAFNALFYATAATVIPVLFLAIAVQGGIYENLIRLTVNAGRQLATEMSQRAWVVIDPRNPHGHAPPKPAAPWPVA